MRNFMPKKRDLTAGIKELIASSRQSESLHLVPDRLANVIKRYDELDIDPHFRHDVYNILSGAIDIADALVDNTFPVEQAGKAVARQLEILARALTYLQARPAKLGFSILVPETHVLTGHFSTKEEAENMLETLSNMGISKNAQIVPIKIISQHAIQPHAPKTTSPEPKHTPATHILSGPLPTGIVPNNTTPQQLPGEHTSDFNPEVTPPADTNTDSNQPFHFPEPDKPSELTLEERMKRLTDGANSLPKS